MQTERFFEDRNGPPERPRRLLIAFMNWEGDPRADGGRREAVRVATTLDVDAYPAAYARYCALFKPAQRG
jgi:hypothetical protein